MSTNYKVGNVLLAKYQKFSEAKQNEINQYYNSIVRDQKNYYNWFFEEVKTELFKQFAVIAGSLSFDNRGTGWITISSCTFRDKYHHKKEIASISIDDNKIHFRNQGAPMVTKVIRFNKELTPARAARYIIKYGYYIRNTRAKIKSDAINLEYLTEFQNHKRILKAIRRAIIKNDKILASADYWGRMGQVIYNSRKFVWMLKDGYYAPVK